jgi:hypothetical protein
MGMQMSFFPKSHPGIWSNLLCVAYILFFILSGALLGSGPDYNTVLAVSLTVVGASIAAASGVTGIISIVKNREKAVLVYLSTAVGLYCLMGCIVSLFGVTQ